MFRIYGFEFRVYCFRVQGCMVKSSGSRVGKASGSRHNQIVGGVSNPKP